MARSSSSDGHLDKHLKDPFTTRDLLGVCRGRCVSKTCPGCPGGYLKRTADYYAKPPPPDPRAFAEDSGKHALEEANRFLDAYEIHTLPRHARSAVTRTMMRHRHNWGGSVILAACGLAMLWHTWNEMRRKGRWRHYRGILRRFMWRGMRRRGR